MKKKIYKLTIEFKPLEILLWVLWSIGLIVAAGEHQTETMWPNLIGLVVFAACSALIYDDYNKKDRK